VLSFTMVSYKHPNKTFT